MHSLLSFGGNHQIDDLAYKKVHLLFFEMVGIPFPAETILTISGFEWSSGVFQLATLLLAAALGNREVMREKRITLTEGLG